MRAAYADQPRCDGGELAIPLPGLEDLLFTLVMTGMDGGRSGSAKEYRGSGTASKAAASRHLAFRVQLSAQ
jgi:hypothetical protein